MYLICNTRSIPTNSIQQFTVCISFASFIQTCFTFLPCKMATHLYNTLSQFLQFHELNWIIIFMLICLSIYTFDNCQRNHVFFSQFIDYVVCIPHFFSFGGFTAQNFSKIQCVPGIWLNKTFLCFHPLKIKRHYFVIVCYFCCDKIYPKFDFFLITWELLMSSSALIVFVSNWHILCRRWLM